MIPESTNDDNEATNDVPDLSLAGDVRSGWHPSGR